MFTSLFTSHIYNSNIKVANNEVKRMFNISKAYNRMPSAAKKH